MMEPAKSKSVDTAAEKTAKSPMCKPRVTLNRCPNANGENNDGEIFSPTSAAALALSTLHHFGADRDSRPSTGSLKGTRLFNKSGDTPVTESVGEHKTKDDSITNEARNSTEPDQAATFAPVCNVNAHHPGALPAVYSYPALSPSIGAAPHYPPPPPHHHHHHPYPSPYSHDPRFAPWSQAPLAPPKSRVGNSSGSKAPPTAMPWHGPSFACPHPPPPGGNYSVDVSFDVPLETFSTALIASSPKLKLSS